FDGDLGIDAMLIEEIDGVDVQTTKGSLGDLADVLRPAVDTAQSARRFGIDLETELGGDDDLIANGSESLAEQLLVRERTVSFGSAQEREAGFEGPAQPVDRLLLLRRWAVAVTESHATEAQGGDFKIFSKFASLHRSLRGSSSTWMQESVVVPHEIIRGA